MITTLFATLALLVVGFKATKPADAGHRDYESSYRYAHAYAKRYRAQRDDVQRRLTIRVKQVWSLSAALTRARAQARRAYARSVDLMTSPDERNMLCIHGGEGSWTDPNAPYYGGIQMDEEFQRTYGREFFDHYGTADHWPVAVQIAVGIKATFTRGYYPWPNTARACGLIG